MIHLSSVCDLAIDKFVWLMSYYYFWLTDLLTPVAQPEMLIGGASLAFSFCSLLSPFSLFFLRSHPFSLFCRSSSNKRHFDIDDCLEDKREDCQNCPYCQLRMHTYTVRHKNTPNFFYYNFKKGYLILIIFGTHIHNTTGHTSLPTLNIIPLKLLFCTFTIISSMPLVHNKYHVSVFLTSLLPLTPQITTFYSLVYHPGLAFTALS